MPERIPFWKEMGWHCSCFLLEINQIQNSKPGARALNAKSDFFLERRGAEKEVSMTPKSSGSRPFDVPFDYAQGFGLRPQASGNAGFGLRPQASGNEGLRQQGI
jgi:hypothetical protein